MARPRRQPPAYATPDEVRDASEQWSSAQLECRDLGHHWRPSDAVHVRRLNYYRLSHSCERCGMRRIREMSERGHVYAQTYEYPDGYLLKGLGRIAGDARDEVRLQATLRGQAITEVTGRAKDSDLPRFGATRKALE